VINHFYQDIPGNSDDIIPWYSKLLRAAPAGATIIELGVWYGRSLAYLATEAHNTGADVTLIGIDLFDDAGDITRNASHKYEPSSMAVVRRNLSPVMSSVQLIHGDTADAAKYFQDASVYAVFIDADHSYPGCLRDIQAWKPKVQRGGYVSGHDYADEYHGVVKAVTEVFGKEVDVRRTVWSVKV
jgi:cephalosporin hydroxylase